MIRLGYDEGHFFLKRMIEERMSIDIWFARYMRKLNDFLLLFLTEIAREIFC